MSLIILRRQHFFFLLSALYSYPAIYLYLIFAILQFEISSLMKWIFFPSLKFFFADYTGSKSPVKT
jgi:hypothetical protein